MSIRKSLAWSYSSQAFVLFVNFASSVILARLLSPREMGVYAFAMAISAILSVFTTLNLHSYIVREGAIEAQTIRAIFTLNAAMNIVLAVVIALIAIVHREFLGEPEIAMVMFVSTAMPLLAIFDFIPTALYQREMNFALLSQLNVCRCVVNVVVVLSCAYEGLGPLSPALGPVAASIFAVGYYAVRRTRDVVAKPTTIGLRPAFIFGIQIMAVSGVAQLAQRLSDVVLGRMLGLAALGLYSRASSLAGIVFSNVYGLATSVVFTKMAKDLREKGSLHETFVLSLRMITAFVWPIMAGIAVLSRPFIHVLYGPKWEGAAAPLALLMVAQFIALGFGMNWELFVLRRETALQARYEGYRAIVGLGAFSIGALFSITAATLGRVAESVLGYFLYRAHVDRLAGTEKGELERIFIESLGLTAIAVSPALVVMMLNDWSFTTDPVLIVVAVLVGTGAWLATICVRRHPLFAEMQRAWIMVRGRLNAAEKDAA